MVHFTWQALCHVLNGTDFPGVGVLQAASLGAWDVGRRQQVDEIAALYLLWLYLLLATLRIYSQYNY